MWTRRGAVTVLGASAAALATTPAHATPAHATPQMRIVPFKTSPFPYDGVVPDTGRPFLDTRQGDEPAHSSPRGGVYAQSTTYSDRSVLLAAAPRRPGALVVFLHGNLVRLQRDVVGRQRVVAQLAASRLDAALVAPQFAVDALDSSAGHFWDPSGFTRFLAETSDQLAAMTRLPAAIYDALPVIIVAYSGGHNPTASILAHGEASDRIAGVILLDALFAYEDIFADWIVRAHERVFFFSAFSRASADRNRFLEGALGARGIAFDTGLPAKLGPGSIAFLDTGPTVSHNDFLTRAWVADPLEVVLARVALA